jgi:hypothetical protein
VLAPFVAAAMEIARDAWRTSTLDRAGQEGVG